MKLSMSAVVTAYACMKSLRMRGASTWSALPSSGVSTSRANVSASGSLNEDVAKEKSANVSEAQIVDAGEEDGQGINCCHGFNEA